MQIYEKRTYCITPGDMPEVIRLYTTEGWPALQAEKFDEKLIGYFISDTGALHQLIHLWRFDDDGDRRKFWTRIYASKQFMSFVVKLRPHIQTQEVQLMTSAPWGPAP